MIAPATGTAAVHWVHACTLADLPPWSGVAALFDQTQIALIRWGDGADHDPIHALGNLDPFSQAQVISRGIVGDHQGQPFIASPVYKQRFRLADGTCIDDATVTIPVYPVRVEHGDVFVGLPGR